MPVAKIWQKVQNRQIDPTTKISKYSKPITVHIPIEDQMNKQNSAFETNILDDEIVPK